MLCGSVMADSNIKKIVEIMNLGKGEFVQLALIGGRAPVVRVQKVNNHVKARLADSLDTIPDISINTNVILESTPCINYCSATSNDAANGNARNLQELIKATKT